MLQVIPVTGRTNQIRVHLWHIGHPVVGDPTYLSGRQMSDRQTLATHDPPLCLHADWLEFRHPRTGQPFQISGRRPAWVSREIQ